MVSQSQEFWKNVLTSHILVFIVLDSQYARQICILLDAENPSLFFISSWQLQSHLDVNEKMQHITDASCIIIEKVQILNFFTGLIIFV